jgi:hypothetical protein
MSRERQRIAPEFSAGLSVLRFGVTTFSIEYGLSAVDLARAVEEPTKRERFTRRSECPGILR